MQGGKYLGKGSYGCAFSPPLKCTNKVDGDVYENSIGKVFPKKKMHNANSEEKTSKFIKINIDPNGEFTPAFKGSCIISVPTQRELRSAPKECEIIDNGYQLIFENGGVNWTQYATKHVGNVKAAIKVFKNLMPVLEGLEKMSQKRVCHIDIKPDNMLISGNKLYMIDFGLMTPFDLVYHEGGILQHNYRYYPFEFKLCNRRMDTSVQRIINIFYENYDKGNLDLELDYAAFFSIFNIDIIKEIREISYHYMHLFRGQEIKGFYNFFIHNVVPKVDIYSLGISLAELFVMIVQGVDLRKVSAKVLQKLVHIRNFVRLLIQPNSMKRLSIDETIKMYKEIHIFL